MVLEYIALAAASALTDKAYADKEARHRRNARKKLRSSPEGRRMQESLERLSALSKSLPRQFEASQTSRAQSAAANRRNRLNRSLARAGFTSGSEVGMRGQRGMVQDLIAGRQNIGLQGAQLEQGLQASQYALNQQANEFFQGGAPPEESYINWADQLMPAMYMAGRDKPNPHEFSYGREGGGGGGGGGGTVPFTDAGYATSLTGDQFVTWE